MGILALKTRKATAVPTAEAGHVNIYSDEEASGTLSFKNSSGTVVRVPEIGTPVESAVTSAKEETVGEKAVVLLFLVKTKAEAAKAVVTVEIMGKAIATEPIATATAGIVPVGPFFVEAKKTWKVTFSGAAESIKVWTQTL